MKKFISEFKAFITRGNVLDMAVGVIVGGAFNTIVTTLNKQVLMPVVNWALSYIGGGNGLFTILPNSEVINTAGMTEEQIANAVAGAQLGPDGLYYKVLNYIDWSAFFESIINFFFIALTLFIIIKVAAFASRKRKEFEEKLAAEKAAKEAQQNPEPEAEPEPEVEPEPEAEPQPDPVITLLTEIRDSLQNKTE